MEENVPLSPNAPSPLTDGIWETNISWGGGIGDGVGVIGDGTGAGGCCIGDGCSGGSSGGSSCGSANGSWSTSRKS